ncbi:MAG: hypothetical protein JRJ00_02915, partial [Deltaproteobacteria bacterium]|nr:hypothetical protein [Deltaproteobacteria bacterium]
MSREGVVKKVSKGNPKGRREIISPAKTVAQESSGGGTSRKWYLLLAVVLLVSFVSYANSLQNEFVFDDMLVIVENPRIRGIDKLTNLLGLERARLSYRPIRMISYALDYTLNEKLWYCIGNYN